MIRRRSSPSTGGMPLRRTASARSRNREIMASTSSSSGIEVTLSRSLLLRAERCLVVAELASRHRPFRKPAICPRSREPTPARGVIVERAAGGGRATRGILPSAELGALTQRWGRCPGYLGAAREEGTTPAIRGGAQLEARVRGAARTVPRVWASTAGSSRILVPLRVRRARGRTRRGRRRRRAPGLLSGVAARVLANLS
jgi:hypothetical protein